MYDNRPSSAIWFRARINALQLGDRNRHTYKETICQICEDENIKEDILHVMLHCPAYKEERHQVIKLQQPYIDKTERKTRDCKLKTLRGELLEE